jgi:hypothetical protein
MNFLEGPFPIRDLSRSSAFDGNSRVGFPDGVKLQKEINLLYPIKVGYAGVWFFSWVVTIQGTR